MSGGIPLIFQHCTGTKLICHVCKIVGYQIYLFYAISCVDRCQVASPCVCVNVVSRFAENAACLATTIIN